MAEIANSGNEHTDAVAETARSREALASAAIDYGVALLVGLFFAACAWLWLSSGEGVVLAAMLTGLPSCF